MISGQFVVEFEYGVEIKANMNTSWVVTRAIPVPPSASYKPQLPIAPGTRSATLKVFQTVEISLGDAKSNKANQLLLERHIRCSRFYIVEVIR